MKEHIRERILERGSEIKIPERAHGALSAYTKAICKTEDFDDLLCQFLDEGLTMFGVPEVKREDLIDYLSLLSSEG